MAPNTVLVVVDEPALADVFTRYLQDEGSVLTAYGGQEAMDLLDESVDLVVLDLRMPDVSGVDVLSWMQEHGYDCPVIVISALEPDETQLPIKPIAHLVKPITGEELLAAVSRALT